MERKHSCALCDDGLAFLLLVVDVMLGVLAAMAYAPWPQP